MKTFEETLNLAIEALPYTPWLDGDEDYREGFIDGLDLAKELLYMNKEYVIREIATDVLNWLNQNPLEWEYGGDVDDIIDKYFKSKRE